MQVPAPLGTHVPVVEDPQLPDDHPIHPVQDFSMAQVVNKLEFNMVVQDKQEVVLDEKKDKKKEENLEAHPNADGDGPPLTKKLKLD